MYPTTDRPMSRPERVYLLKDRVNVSLDELLIRELVPRVKAWLSDTSLKTPLAPSGEKDGESWLETLHRPERVFENLIPAIKEMGPGALLTELGTILGLVVKGKGGRVGVFIANGTPQRLRVQAYQLNRTKGAFKFGADVEPYSWVLNVSEEDAGDAPMVYWMLSSHGGPSKFLEEIVKADLSELEVSQIAKILTKSEGVAGVVWFASGDSELAIARSDSSGLLQRYAPPTEAFVRAPRSAPQPKSSQRPPPSPRMLSEKACRDSRRRMVRLSPSPHPRRT